MIYEYTAYQDGRDFYLYEDSAFIAVISYPKRVTDSDMEGAIKAREWFEKLMRQWNLLVYFL